MVDSQCAQSLCLQTGRSQHVLFLQLRRPCAEASALRKPTLMLTRHESTCAVLAAASALCRSFCFAQANTDANSSPIRCHQCCKKTCRSPQIINEQWQTVLHGGLVHISGIW